MHKTVLLASRAARLGVVLSQILLGHPWSGRASAMRSYRMTGVEPGVIGSDSVLALRCGANTTL
jgi:hypothetical protein